MLLHLKTKMAEKNFLKKHKRNIFICLITWIK